MARARSSMGFFGMFGRSSDLRQLDSALRAVDVHPALVPEGAKLAVVNLMKDEAGGRMPPPQAFAPVAELLGYCMLGREAFARAHGEARRLAVETRVESALDEPAHRDAPYLLLMIHSKLIQPSVVDDFDLRAEE
ncbi:hypothetical protein [Pararhizobium haloflavum]|uniref:hypothetical protein n=1 Tax=Pararhizobium haloflavum TaxID=2037914 RepID=UPI000C19C6C2|nr:hypothetical protein [Pararhizobium haloflavum]